MNPTIPPGVLDRDRHWGFQRLAGAANETSCVRGTGQAEEEGGAHVDEDDPPEDLTDCKRHCTPRVPGLGGGNGHGFAARVESRTEYKDFCYPAETVGEGAGIVPVVEAQGMFLAVEPAGCVDN